MSAEAEGSLSCFAGKRFQNTTGRRWRLHNDVQALLGRLEVVFSDVTLLCIRAFAKSFGNGSKHCVQRLTTHHLLGAQSRNAESKYLADVYAMRIDRASNGRPSRSCMYWRIQEIAC